jgi:NAD(P)-dependent dehydrogenase (short-subunit alcohol dehydrogenase family)
MELYSLTIQGVTVTHNGRVAVVTGASRGIGQAIALSLAERGAQVACIDLNDTSDTEARVRAINGDFLGITADVSSPDDVSNAAHLVQKHFGRCDILVNNAGIYPHKQFEELKFAEWKRVISVNLDSQFLMSQAFVPTMKVQGWGRIINFTSGSVQLAVEGMSAYKASKMGAIGLTRGMASDLGRYGITVNAVSPSLVGTPGVLAGPGAAKLEMMANTQAIKRRSEPTDIVGLILFLTSQESHFVTGQTILADGGLTFF